MICTTSQRILAFSIGSAFLILSIAISLTWSSFSLKIAYQQLVLANGTENFKNWLKTPFPIYFEIYLFNISNSKEWAANPKQIKPDMKEIGPYVFQEVRERVGLDAEGETIKFNQTRTWYFRPELSNNLTLDDLITSINPISATLNYNLRYLPGLEKRIVHAIIDQMGSLFITKSVKELLFSGYSDNQLDYLNRIKKVFPRLPSIPMKKFAWFIGRNTSAAYDGQMEMNNGRYDIFKLGLLQKWNGVNHTSFFPRECGNVIGTTGELWPPMKFNYEHSITMYIVDICRSLTLQASKNITKFNLDGIQWIGDRKMLDGMDTDISSNCWCLATKCPDLRPGVFNASTCQQNSPSFISYPHFYLADPYYRNSVTGMNASKNRHQFYVNLNPKYGIPLEIRARLQINFLIEQDSSSSLYKNIPTTFIPMFWFSQNADISQELVDQVLLLNTIQSGGLWVCYFFAFISVIVLLIALVITVRVITTEDEEVSPIMNDATSLTSEGCVPEA